MKGGAGRKLYGPAAVPVSLPLTRPSQNGSQPLARAPVKGLL
ncbi:MAG: hypothetical protein JWL99_6960 [Streptomyces oryziradicis]|jgi:hypothetical protein|nr:hypothetical protein [Actinacidiphila oryziradicis]